MTVKALPWHATVAVADIPETGLHHEIEAGEADRRAIAAVAGLRELPRLAASFDLAHAAGGRVHVTGRIQAAVGQTCVVTLDPLTNEIDEDVDVVFSDEPAPPVATSRPQGDGEDDDAPVEDPPEPIVGGMIDLGALAAEFLILAIDPYPRKPGAVFEPVIAPPDPADHPFAGLASLKESDSQGKPRKNKSK
ncbi:DUF177 domain-containing protein [Bradyrhizobium sp. LHD-71]|uniref:YceD family protein n=1 Tax=Bradyrhizobium sp. LHD-71 TaxID=3072141 RepID=UPI00280DB807|nr:DUF177 domain-containing protein [Bradyrhizobium sp. LHD-71]MDQ8726137.1 DUF177 domain-containing protein [Bradyrhizobium sp. LHD-71]